MSKHLKKRLECKTLVKEFFAFLIIGLFSAGIGCLIAFPFILINKVAVIDGFIMASSLGFVIGIVSRALFAVVFSIIYDNPFWAFSAVFLTIGIGTVGGSLVFGFVIPIQLAVMCILSEAVGMSACFLVYRYTNKLNNQLHKTQRRLESE